MRDLEPLSVFEPLAERTQLARDVESAKHYGRAARSPRTRLEYARDWVQFTRYCERVGLVPFPAESQTVAAYLASIAGKLKATTIQQRAAAIAFPHRQNGLAPPTAHPLVADVLAGITREHGMAPQRKAALTIELLRETLAASDDGLGACLLSDSSRIDCGR